MSTPRLSVFFALLLVLSLCAAPHTARANPASAQPPTPPVTFERYRPTPPEPKQTDSKIIDAGRVDLSPASASGLSWFTCGSCPEQAEVSVAGDTVTVGVANRPEYSWQARAAHGAAAQLPSASKYTITFDYNFYTWDSYQPTEMAYKGYWDALLVSVSGQPYWQTSHTDPVTPAVLPGLAFITGGSTWGQGVLQHYSGSQTVTVAADPSGTTYLNVILDTASQLFTDNAFPSWGTVTIKSVLSDQNASDLGSQAAELAKRVVGGPYGWGGKGWDNAAKKYVEPEVIQTGALYTYWVAAQKKFMPASGVDCSGLVHWAFDKASGSTAYYGSPVYYEGAADECSDKQSDPVASKEDLRPGDILCYNYAGSIDHVAMYVGGSDPTRNVVEAGGSGGDRIVYASLNTRTDSTSSFKFFRRIKPAVVPLKIQSHSPVTLVVTDPDGLTVAVDTLVDAGTEFIRGIPGQLYYGTDENGDDVVYAPVLKPGTYTVQVVPKPEALPTDRFSLDAMGAAKFVQLAQDVQISDIPSSGFGIVSTGDEIVPAQPTLIGNQSPSADAGGLWNVAEGDAVSLTGAGSDPDGDPLTFAWDLDNDGAFETPGQNATFSAAGLDGPSTHTIVLQVCDDKGACATANASVDVLNLAPVASSDLPYQEVHTGWPIEPVTITAADIPLDAALSIATSWRSSNAPAQSALPYGLTLAPGACVTSGASSTCTWTLAGRALLEAGVYTITATVSDDDGGTSSTQIRIVVFNKGPVADAGGPYTVPEGGQITLSGIGSDPEHDPLTYAWDLDDDGDFEEHGASVIFSADDRDGPDAQGIVFRVCDRNGACMTSESAITITNVAPALTNSLPEQSVQYSDPITAVTITAADVAADPLTAATSWTINDGTPQAGLPDGLALTTGACTPAGGSAACSWTLSGKAMVAPGAYKVTVAIDDKDGGVSSTDIVLTVEPEDAQVTYTGDLAVSTPDHATSTATVRLAAVIRDITAVDSASDADAGDIRNADLTFVNPDTGAVICTAPITLVDEADPKTGAASCDWEVSIEGNTQSFATDVQVGGYYTSERAANVLVTVTRAPALLYLPVIGAMQ